MSFRHTGWKFFLGFVVFLILFISGAYAGFPVIHFFEKVFCEDKYDFVNPRVVCRHEDAAISKVGYTVLRNKLVQNIEAEKALGHLTEASVYFRDLENGPVFGINESSKFVPASLLKVPLAIFFLGLAESDPQLLSRKLTIEESVHNALSSAESAQGLQQNFRPTEEVVANQPYTIEELLFHMIAYSDNVAQGVLLKYAYAAFGGEEVLMQSFEELGIVDPTYADDTITVRGYAGLFRLLYHVSHLPPKLSEKLLSWLAQSDFKDGLEMGVPSKIEIAHKFGEREVGKKQQLHDCGIVYFSENPYLLCVMTRGDDVYELARVIAEISKMVYEEVDSRRL